MAELERAMARETTYDMRPVNEEMMTLDDDDAGPCSCCGKSIDEGQVIIFNNKCWHPGCFRCITCENLLDINMNVYLDGEGNPICANCNNCSICNQPITDFAMMYGKEMYHEECFRCQECQRPISGTVYANTSKGVFCVNCHNERVTRSRKLHEERRRRQKEREERKARRDREKLSPNSMIDRDKSLPAPPSEPSPNLSTPNTLSPMLLSETVFQSQILGTRVNGTAEDQLRARRYSAAALSTEKKPNGLSAEQESASDQDLSSTQRPKAERSATEDQLAFIPVLLDRSSLPNTPDPTRPELEIESPVLGFHTQSQSPVSSNSELLKPVANDQPLQSPVRLDTVPPSGSPPKSSIATMAKGATEALSRKMSLRARRKSSKSQNGSASQDFKLEDIPFRKTSDVQDSVPLPPRSAIPDFPNPPSTTPLRNSGAVSSGEVNPKSDQSASPPASPAQFLMRNDSVSEVSTEMTPTSMTFEGKNTSPLPASAVSASPSVPTRYQHHSPKPSTSAPQHTPDSSAGDSRHSRKFSVKATTPSDHTARHGPSESTSYISMDSSSRPSTANSSEFPETPQATSPPAPFIEESPQLPSIPSTGSLILEDEMSQMWLQHDHKGSQGSIEHKRVTSNSSQTGNMFSKVANSFWTRRDSTDQKAGTHSRESSKGHSRNASQPSTLATTFLAEAEEEKTELRRQLRKSLNQLVELEMRLRDDDELKLIENKLEGTKDALAAVETEREMALRELKVLLRHHHGVKESANPPTARETCDAILKDFEVSLERLKDQMREQIKGYTSVRTQLVEETVRLRKLRDQYLEEAQQLNKKNDELADLNNDIQRNMDRTPNHAKSLSDTRGGFSLFKTHKRDSPTAGSISSGQSVLFKNDVAHPMYFEPKKSSELLTTESPSRVSDATITIDEPVMTKVVTRVTDQDGVDVPPQPKKVNYWIKNTSALQKKAVKGFKSVWSGDSTSPQQATISSPQLVSSSSQGGGLNILLPQTTLSPAPTFDNSQNDTYKTHSFHPKSFKRWQKCGFCGEKLSGTEFRCTDCDYQCHAKCLMSVNVACTNSRKGVRDPDSSSIASETATLFGNDLARQAELEGRPVPYIVTRCIEEVEVNGMDYEGIYRKSGGASSLRAIIDAFEAGGEVNFDHLTGSGDICAVTSALKQYFRSLPDPLLPFSIYDRCLQAAVGNDNNLKIAKFRKVLDAMPKANYDCLELLMLHLARVTEKSDVNLMHANNLAVVFSPTVMRDMTGARQILDMQATNLCVKFLIENAKALFIPAKMSLTIDRSANGISARLVDRRI